MRISFRLAFLLLAGGCVAAQAGGALDDEAAELRIAVGLLRSQASELALLEQQAQRGQVPPRYVRAHASQLLQAVERAGKQLSQARTPLSARPQAELAQAAARELTGELTRLRSSGRAQEASSRPSLRARLQQAEQALQPAS